MVSDKKVLALEFFVTRLIIDNIIRNSSALHVRFFKQNPLKVHSLQSMNQYRNIETPLLECKVLDERNMNVEKIAVAFNLRESIVRGIISSLKKDLPEI